MNGEVRMKENNRQPYFLDHVCIYDSEPRDSMWKFLRWNHGISAYFTGDTFHITDEGHSDYTFYACGSPFQFQLEAPPFQFKYEQEWWKKYGRGYNHICWRVNDAKASFDQLLRDGASICQEYTVFPTYNGFVLADPEGTWVEIMEYTTNLQIPQVVSGPIGLEGLRLFGTGLLVKNLRSMERWYAGALGLRTIFESVEGKEGMVYMAAPDYNPVQSNIVLQIATPSTQEECRQFERFGSQIAVIMYLADNVPMAWESALGAGLEPISEPAVDTRTGVLTAWIREPNGNPLLVRAPFG
jgi:catechol 2,3-dioxygenase-like lactoylglutathione lyase family enzyme